jgi:hypothetical protein
VMKQPSRFFAPLREGEIATMATSREVLSMCIEDNIQRKGTQ